jgi:GTP1/Obg family GTP-binding protein
MIDTPGTLNRFNKMNDIEKLAWLAMKHVTHLIVYIFDLTEPYPIAEQEKLFEKIKETGKPVLVYLSKTDILEEDKVKEFRKGYKNAFVDANKLKEDIIKRMPEEETEEEKE